MPSRGLDRGDYPTPIGRTGQEATSSMRALTEILGANCLYAMMGRARPTVVGALFCGGS